MSTSGPSRGLCSSPRQTSLSTTLHERERTARGQSTPSFQGAYSGQPSFPTLGARTIPGQIRHATSPMSLRASRDDIPESPPAPTHSANPRSILHHMAPQQVHSRCQSDPPQPQMVQRLAQPTPRPRVMSLDILLPSDQPHSVEGTSGVAYAGGATSGPVSRSTTQLGSSSLSKDSTLERVRRNTTSCDMDRETWELQRRSIVQRDTSQRTWQPSPELELQRTDSPKSFYSFGGPGLSDRELRSAQATSLPPSPAPVRMYHVRNHCAQPLRWLGSPHNHQLVRLLIHGSSINLYHSKRRMTRMSPIHLIITGSKSPTDGHLVGAWPGGLPMSANRKPVSLGASSKMLRFLRPHRTPSHHTIMATLTPHILARRHLSHLLLTATRLPRLFHLSSQG
ncbi:hypothetical protein EI94DRAFT_1336543 [Lactarius quietus]|nr:hypothetical protein EI94DRAFT_1336543 [Lactarius quietus]